MTPQFVQDAAKEAAERINSECVEVSSHGDISVDHHKAEAIILAAIQRAGVELAAKDARIAELEEALEDRHEELNRQFVMRAVSPAPADNKETA